MTIPENPSGADLVAALDARARELGLSDKQFFAPLTRYPSNWKRELACVKFPKPHTIRRVRALLSGETPEPPRRKALMPPPARSRPAPTPTRAMSRAEQLRAEIFAESSTALARRNAALSTGTVVAVGEHLTMPAGPVLAAPVAGPGDPRPIADGREPCRRCGIRGDLGCAHQRPDPQYLQPSIMEDTPC